MIKDINDFVFHDQQTKNRVMMFVNSRQIFPASRKGIIFYGDYGCGKTTLATFMPNAIDNARQAIFSSGLDLKIECADKFCRAQMSAVQECLQGHIVRNEPYHYILFDEFDQYSDNNQQQFKSVLTNPNIGFFITTNDLSKITPSVQSRCHLVELKQPSVPVWEQYAKNMFAQRNVPLSDLEIQDAIKSARTLSQRDMTATLEILMYSKQQEKSAA